MTKNYKAFMNRPENIECIYDEMQKVLDNRNAAWSDYNTTYNELKNLLHDLKMFTEEA